jgi:CRP/FNR family transcriptional regulator
MTPIEASEISRNPGNIEPLLSSIYPQLAENGNIEWLNIISNAQLISPPAQTILVRENMPISNFMLLLEGRLRVFHLAEDGREVTLYRINPGDICLMSLNSLLNDQPFEANTQAETQIVALSFSIKDFNKALELSHAFRHLVLSNMSQNLNDMMKTCYETAFHKLHMRLACILGQFFEREQSTTLKITHDKLAHELGTSREAVSRMLKKIEASGCITLSRGHITMVPGKEMTDSFQ